MGAGSRTGLSARSRQAVGRGGYAAVDALVALTILTLTLVMALAAGAHAREAAILADETHKARDLMQFLLASTPSSSGGESSGLSGDFAWATTEGRISNAAASATIQVCQRAVELKSRATGRRYGLMAASLCAAPDAR